MPAPHNPLDRLFGRDDKDDEAPRQKGEQEENDATAKAHAYLEEVRRKMERLAEDFAAGKVNTTQFQELYAHYQQERKAIEETLEETPEAAAWHATTAMEAGESVIIRRRHTARILGYAIYLSGSTAPLRSVGKYDLDERLVASMLDGQAGAGTGQQTRGIELDDSRWVGFIPGKHTMLVVLFSVEPARAQLDMLRDLQGHFESANERLLARGVTDPSKLVFPHAAVFE